MNFSHKITDVFECSLDRAFRAPILGDATKFMKGYLFQPPVTGFEVKFRFKSLYTLLDLFSFCLATSQAIILRYYLSLVTLYVLDHPYL